jgi:hypothetical protein
MGTFHDHASPLHGITVAVETAGDELWVGRCDDEDDERVILLDADVHTNGDGAAASREEWLAKAARFGIWPRHKRVVLPRGRVESIRRLGDLS